MYDILNDAYSFDSRCAQCWDEDWRQSDDFFFDNLQIAEKYSLVTCWQGQPVGFIVWDPRHRPEYVAIGHNGIRAAFKGRGFGKAQLKKALRQIREYEGLKEIRVLTNSSLVAPRNYESAGFVLYDRKEKKETPFSGDYLYYRIPLRKYRTIEVVDWRVNFTSDAPANFAGLLAVSQENCRMQLAEKAPPGVLPYCAVLP